MGYECAVLQLGEDGWGRVYEGVEHAESPEEAARAAVKEALLSGHITIGLDAVVKETAGIRVLVRGPDGGAPRGYEVLLTLAVSAGVQVDDAATKTLRKAARWDL